MGQGSGLGKTMKAELTVFNKRNQRVSLLATQLQWGETQQRTQDWHLDVEAFGGRPWGEILAMFDKRGQRVSPLTHMRWGERDSGVFSNGGWTRNLLGGRTRRWH